MTRLDLIGKIIMEDGFSEPLGKLESESMAAESALGGIKTTLGAIGVAFSAAAITKGIFDLTELGAQAETVATAYENLARANGVNAQALLDGLREASRGAVADTELMITANRALLAGGAQLANELPRLFEIARASASATGQDIGYVFETLIKGIVKASPLLIDNADIYIKVGDAVEQYAASVGKSVDELSAQERQLAVLNGVLEQGAGFINKVGLESKTSAEKMESLGVAIQNVKRALGELLVKKGVPQFISGLAQGIEDSLTLKDLQSQLSDTLDQYEKFVGEYKDLSEQQKAYINDIIETAKRANTLALLGGIEGKNQAVQDYRDILASLQAAINESPAFKANRWEVAIRPEEVGFNEVHAQIKQTEKELEDLQAMSPVDIFVRIQQEGEDVAARLQRVVDRYAGDLPLDMYREFTAQVGRASQQLAVMRVIMGDNADATWYEAQAVKVLKDALEGVTNEVTDMPQRVRSVSDSFSTLRSDIESVLTGDMSVIAGDMLATQLGTYQDKALESARRLADIANKGTASPWAKFFEIPPDVLAQGEEAVKLWAKSLQKDVTDLTRPDLIDWDAFVAQFREAKEREAAKELTIDIAVEKLTAAGLLSGSKEERKKKVAQMLGIEAPDLEFHPVLKVENDDIAAMGASLTSSVDRHSDPILDAGKRMGNFMLDGIKRAFDEAGDAFFVELAGKLFPEILSLLTANGAVALP